MINEYVERVVNLIPEDSHRLYQISYEDACDLVLSGDPEAVSQIEGSYALLAKEGKTVRMARSLDRPMRYFLAKREEGPALIVADRMDTIKEWLVQEGFEDQFHPSYTRMVPAHYVVEIQLIGCPDPDPIYKRFFDPQKNTQSSNLEQIGRQYIGALAEEIAKWISTVPSKEPIGVCFSGGIDSGAVFRNTAPLSIPPEKQTPMGSLEGTVEIHLAISSANAPMYCLPICSKLLDCVFFCGSKKRL